MKKQFIYLLLGTIVVLGSAFTPTRQGEPIKDTRVEVTVAYVDNSTGVAINIEEKFLVEPSKFKDFVKADLRNRGVTYFFCNCTSTPPDETGICHMTCCIYCGMACPELGGQYCYTVTGDCGMPPQGICE